MRIGPPKDLFSYQESVFREDLFLYNGLQGVCYRVGIDPLGLVSWMQNLRMWISQTVLVR